MLVLKCKMCGANLNIADKSSVVECDHCGSMQTFPQPDSEKKLNLFARANKLRMAADFDKAAGIYESIVAQFPEEAEAYWGLVLCKYGVEYVDDPATGKKIPTCHRSSYDSVLEDDDFEQTLENADPQARTQYREEAKFLESLRKRIVEVSSKEDPYDIFISYKETDFNGERTIDSVLAQDIYQMLTKKGYRVFFSRVTLKSHLGKEYEPYIFAALNSAKIMLVVGTDYEFFNAPWVKNEWSRYLQLIAKGDQKTLIPCYKNIGIDDMPREFAALQAQNLGVVGYLQDLESGIEKILPLENVGQAFGAAQPKTVATTDSYLTRVQQFLIDGDFAKADEYAEKVLDIDPTNGKAHLCKLMVEFRVKEEKALGEVGSRLDLSKNYAKVLQFGDDALRERMTAYNDAVYKRIGKRNALLQAAEQKKQEVLSEVNRSQELVHKAQSKCQTIQSAIDQKGAYLRELKQNIQALTERQAAQAVEAKVKGVPMWIMLPLALAAFVVLFALMFCGGRYLFGGVVTCGIMFVIFAVGAVVYTASYYAKNDECSVPIGLLVCTCVIVFVIALSLEHGGPLELIFKVLSNVLMALFGDSEKIFTFQVWANTWTFSAVLVYLYALVVSFNSMIKRIERKHELNETSRLLTMRTAEYESKMQNDEELRKLHVSLKNAQAEHSSTLGSCRATIHQQYNEYCRLANACNLKPEALVPKPFD